MKIYVFGTRGFPGIQGGVEKHCQELYPLIPGPFRITVFRRKAYLPPNAGKQYKNIRFIDIVSTKVKGVEPFVHSFLCTLICICRRPDIVHIHNIGPGLFVPLLKLARIPVVLTYHSPNYEHRKWGRAARFALKLSEYISLRLSDYIIFVSRHQWNKYPGKIKDKSAFIPNGITCKGKSAHTDYLQSLGVTPGKYILSVGRITQEKGFDYLIDAFAALNRPEYKLVIAGGIDNKQGFAAGLLKKAQQKGVVMPGVVSGEPLRQLYSHAKLFVLPSYNEGFPIVLLEAMSYDLPVIAGDIPANRQVSLPEDTFFQTGDAASLCNKMQYRINHPLPVPSYNLAKYNWKDIAAEVAGIYKRVKAPYSSAGLRMM
jgi:glycosyltransferase involved in cell wall biosynthesis